MAKQSGMDLRVTINTGTVGAPVMTAVDCEGNGSLTVNKAQVDITGKCSTGSWMELLPAGGVRDWSLSSSGSINVGSAAIETAISIMLTGTTLTAVQFKQLGTKMFYGDAQITSFTIDASYDSVVTYTMEITGSGPLSYGTAT